MIHTDCFAYNGIRKDKSCAVLKELYCEKSECNFYKKDINGKYPKKEKENIYAKTEDTKE